MHGAEQTSEPFSQLLGSSLSASGSTVNSISLPPCVFPANDMRAPSDSSSSQVGVYYIYVYIFCSFENDTLLRCNLKREKKTRERTEAYVRLISH